MPYLAADRRRGLRTRFASFFRKSRESQRERMFRSADETYTKMLRDSAFAHDRAGRLNVMRGWFLDNADDFAAWAHSRGFRRDEIQRALYASRHASRRLTYRQRKHLRAQGRPDFYALPERQALILVDEHGELDPRHIRNAAARLSMMHRRGSVNAEEWRVARRRIMRAACLTGVEQTCRAKLAA